MKKLILLFSLSLFIFSCGEKTTPDLPKQKKELRDDGRRIYSEGGLTVLEYYDVGTMYGTKNGEKFEEDYSKKILVYYEGRINPDKMRSHESCKFHLKTVEYYDKKDGGGKEWEEIYKNCRLNGKKIHWDENGNKIGIENYKDGKLEGKQIKYYEGGDGLIDQESYYKNGKLDGELKIYDHWNNDMRIITFKEGIEVSNTIIPIK